MERYGWVSYYQRYAGLVIVSSADVLQAGRKFIDQTGW
jgi:hypothetical protein